MNELLVQQYTAQYDTDLTDDQWLSIAPCVAFVYGNPGRPATVSRRAVVHGLLYALRSGCPWRLMPKTYPKHSILRYYLRTWADDGTLDDLLRVLVARDRAAMGRPDPPPAAIIDSQTVKTAPIPGDRGYDGGKKLIGRKRHCMVDTHGHLLTVCVSCADIHDSEGAEWMVPTRKQQYPTVRHLWADSRYAGDLVTECADTYQITLEIVKKTNNAPGFSVQPYRWAIERTYAWFTRCRRFVRDYEGTDVMSSAFLCLAHIQLLLNRLFPHPMRQKPYIKRELTTTI